MNNLIVLLKAAIALLVILSIGYLPMKWLANRLWPTPPVPISLSVIPFRTRAAWSIFQFCVFIAVAWMLAYEDGPDIRQDKLLFIGLSAGGTAYLSSVLASWALGMLGRMKYRLRSGHIGLRLSQRLHERRAVRIPNRGGVDRASPERRR
jgi:hypothetical protein